MLLALAVLASQVATIIRVLLRPHRDPASRISWIAVILAVPVVGVLGYILLGETSIGRRRIARLRRALEALPPPAETPAPEIPARHQPLFRVGRSISGYPPIGGNTARLLADSDAAIQALVADIHAATEHVHLLFYIWLPDRNGRRVVEAVCRAARRGVACRVLVDDIGSKHLVRSPHWLAMAAAGAALSRALRVGFPLLRPLNGRIDLRDHRKLAVIDNRIAWCGSQNCADPEFRVKARFAPWVDMMMRFEGPVALQNQHLFASDWAAWRGEHLGALLLDPPAFAPEGFAAQVIASGPTVRNSAMPEIFQTLIYGARRELTVTTPYYVPNGALHAALCAAGYRGVAVTLVLPARNDNWAVAAASRSYYADLLEAGVRLLEYRDGLLHAKTLTLDGEVTLIGSANMDRRSFDLNYENNILFCDAATTGEVRGRQESYIAASRAVTPGEVAAWPAWRRLWNNMVAVLSPVL
ncbi:cardiolipin synthase [Roseococcus sp. SYP-B2431]|uniref:cardiolipin synthase n=1 Tax=Roseococcus sp. SYP-B2431 TaxID=2496640 RepID=UPI00103B03F3|nr:cardiolipin synthase [Roseococcus sp. SYP-B2431]TCI00161.1 cardiolipin synthase [Roseococcus sp. SYP-B2431]